MQAYKQGSRPTIGVLAGWQVYEGTIPTSFLGPLLRGIYKAAKEQDCNLLLSCGVYHDPTTHRPAWPARAEDGDFVPVGPWNTDGLLVVPDLVSPERSTYIQQLIAAGHPVVFIGTGENGPTLVADNEGGIQQAVAHLHSHGHTQIAFIGGRPADPGESRRRLNAFRAALQRFNLELDDRLIAYGSFNRFGGYQAMQTLLRTGRPFTAVVISNDESAKGALQALHEAGLAVPTDIAIIGFDDQLDSRAQVPPLTTVHQPVFELGEQALNWLIARIHGRANNINFIEVPTRLVVRNSCGCQPESMLTISSAPPKHLATLIPAQYQAQVVRAMVEAVLAEARMLSEARANQFCQDLYTSFYQSLQLMDSSYFRTAYLAVLQDADTPEDDAYIWYPALAVLDSSLPGLLEASPQPGAHRFAEVLLIQARSAITQKLRWQHTRDLVGDASLLDELGQFTSHLSITLEEDQIFEIMNTYLPRLGVLHGHVFFYQPDADDMQAWSVMPHKAARTAHYPQEAQRFLSQAFPPPGIYPVDSAFYLALLPLHIQAKLVGFVAFDAGNLAPCAAIVRQLASALGSARLHNAAVEGWRAAEEANRLKSSFLSIVSHELRTPVTLLVGLSEMLLKDGAFSTLPIDSQHNIEQINQGSQHLDRFLRDILDLASSQVGQLRLDATSVDLHEVFQVVLATGQHLAQAKGLAWHVEIAPDLPKVWGDATRLRQVALNLVNNAAKFTSQGQITFRVTTDTKTVTVTVQDTGLGINPAEQELIFDEFRQSQRTATRGYGGTGLGLSISKRLVEMHGGTIGVHSTGQDGVGASFYFTLPALQTMESLHGVLTTLGRTIVALGETPDGTNALLQSLLKKGYQVNWLWASVENTDWLTKLSAQPPDALLLDLHLAAAHVGEITQILKTNLVTRSIPILYYHLADDGQSGALLELDYLTKPVGEETMVGALERRNLLPAPGISVGILIVDDDPAILEMHARVVQKISPTYQVWRATNGREALNILAQNHPALVLLDLRMPELDGFGVLQAMQQNPATRHVPVIVLTAQSLTVEDLARLSNGVTSVLTKDMFSLEEVAGAVLRVLKRQNKLGSDGQRLVRQVLVYIHQHYSEVLSPEILAAEANISTSYLFHIFRTEVGVTPMAYLTRYRIARAKDLLTSTTKRVTEIAYEVGFSDSPYFARVFQRETGVSPSAYRQGGK